MVNRKLAGWGTVAIVVGRFINQYLKDIIWLHLVPTSPVKFKIIWK